MKECTLKVCPKCGRLEKQGSWVPIMKEFSFMMIDLFQNGIEKVILVAEKCPQCRRS